MTVVEERRQRLTFTSEWSVVKWDEAPEFVGRQQAAVAGTKAADAVGSRPGVIVVAEFKDFDHPRIPAGQRAAVARQAVSDVLLDAVSRKVVDTLCGATFSHAADDSRSSTLRAWRRELEGEGPALLVLVCVEVPRTQALATIAWTAKLKQRLHWLGPRARVVVTSRHSPFDGLGVRYEVT